jgi:molybdopterin biosynthesis enzyme
VRPRYDRIVRSSPPDYVDVVTPLEDAQAFVLESCPPLPEREVARSEALGLVLAAAIDAGEVVRRIVRSDPARRSAS